MVKTDDVIHFNVPPFIEKSFDYMRDAVNSHKICGDGKYTKLCNQWMEETFRATKALLTTSGSSALDMAALLCDVKPGDEVILPSFTFSSTANAFALRGAKLVFVDVRPDTMNIDEKKIELAITDKTKVIVPVHYAGVACEMDEIMAIACKYNLFVVEDAAQAVTSTYKGKFCGTIGDFGVYSFNGNKIITEKRGLTALRFLEEKWRSTIGLNMEIAIYSLILMRRIFGRSLKRVMKFRKTGWIHGGLIGRRLSRVKINGA